MSQTGNAHDSDDCDVDCPHPEHQWDGDAVPDLWSMLLGRLGPVPREEREVAFSGEPLVL